MYKCTAAIMHFGNAQWKQRPREEQAEAETTEDCEKVAHLLDIDAAELIKGLLKPRIKVNNYYNSLRLCNKLVLYILLGR